LGIVGSGRVAEKGFFAAGAEGFREAVGKTTLIVKLVAQMFSSEGSITENLGGPVLVARTVHEQATHAGLTGVLKIAAILSINLGLLNLLPIPALDGGHVLFNLLELLFRRPVPERFRASVTYAGFIFLIGVMVLATALDLFRMVS
jgi:regulator of sigma E protease